MVKYSISTNRLLLSSTCFDGFAAENAPGTTGILFTFFRSHWTRLKTTSSKISSFEYLDGSVVPWYWNPSDSRACNGWILRFIQSNMIVFPLNIFCLRMAIRSSSSEIWLSSTGFLFHSGHWIGGPGGNGWKTSWLVLDIEPLGFPFDYFITKVIRDIHSILPLPKLETRAPYYI